MTRRSDGRWVEAITLSNGKRKYIYGKSKSELLLKLSEFTERTTRPLFRTVAEEWYEAFERTATYNTHQAYISVYKLVLAHFGQKHIQDISPLDIQLFLQAKNDEGYSASTVKRIKSLLSKIFSWEILKSDGVIKHDPTKETKLPRFDKRRIHSATLDQEKIIRERVNEPFGLFAFLLLHTGCRSGEALALQWKDVDFENGIIHISKSVVFEPKGTVVKTPKTATSVRSVPLLLPLRSELEKINPRPKDHYIFGTAQPISKKEYRHLWHAYATKAGFLKYRYHKTAKGKRYRDRFSILTPHQLRHSFATMCLEAELSPEDAQHILGHADIQTTINVYTDIREQKRRIAYEKLDAFLQKK